MNAIKDIPAVGSIMNHGAIPTLFEDDHMKITYLDGEGDFCMVTFVGVGLGQGGVDIQNEEFKKLDPNLGPQIFVFDKNRSWGNAIDFEKMTSIIAPISENRRVITMGLSMGGFLAVVASKYLSPEACIAFVPQYSMHPQIMPGERRWAAYARNITKWNIPSLEAYFDQETQFYVFFTADPMERQHLVKFPDQDNIQTYMVRTNGHNVGQAMKDAGILYPTIEACMKLAQPGEMPFSFEKSGHIHVI